MDKISLKRQFQISKWMPFDSFIHTALAKKIVPVKIRNWICDKYDYSLGLYNNYDEDELDYWEEYEDYGSDS